MRDPYVYPNTEVLKNKFKIKTQEKLKEAEAAATALRIKQLGMTPLEGNFDFQHFCNIHKYIFQDLYEWAGKPRTITIEKAERVLSGWSVEYAKPEEIAASAKDVLGRMNEKDWQCMSWDERVNTFAKDMADLWQVHAFREGNTRTTVIFCCDFAESHGIPIDRDLFVKNSPFLRDSLVAHCAVFKDVGDLSQPYHLRRIVDGAMLRGAEREELAKKSAGKTMDEWKQKIEQERQKAAQAQEAKDRPTHDRGDR